MAATQKGKVRNAVILTVFDRAPLHLQNTLEALAKQTAREETAVIVVDDGSNSSYQDIVRQYHDRLNLHWHNSYDTQRDRDGVYTIGDGYNNSAYAMNCALREAEKLDAENVVVCCSDVIIPPHAIERALAFPLDKTVVVGTTIDMDTGTVLCSPSKVWPMLWFLVTRTKSLRAIDGWDEQYLRGQAFENNDLVGRLLLEVGALTITKHVTCFHQTHEQVAYSDDNKGFKINEAYTANKWGGVPFRTNDECLAFERRNTHPGVVHLIHPCGKYGADRSGVTPPTLALEEDQDGRLTAVMDPKKEKRHSISHRELEILRDMCSGRRVLEFGTGLGIATRAAITKGVKVWTVDIDPWIHENVFPGLETIQGVECYESFADAERDRPDPDTFLFDLGDDIEALRACVGVARSLCVPDKKSFFVFCNAADKKVQEAVLALGFDIETSFDSIGGIACAWHARPQLEAV